MDKKIKHNYKLAGKKDGIFYFYCDKCFKEKHDIEADLTECEKSIDKKD